MSDKEHQDILTVYRMMGKLTGNNLDHITYVKYKRPEQRLIRAIEHLTNTLYTRELRHAPADGKLAYAPWSVFMAHRDAVKILAHALKNVTMPLRDRERPGDGLVGLETEVEG